MVDLSYYDLKVVQLVGELEQAIRERDSRRNEYQIAEQRVQKLRSILRVEAPEANVAIQELAGKSLFVDNVAGAQPELGTIQYRAVWHLIQSDPFKNWSITEICQRLIEQNIPNDNKQIGTTLARLARQGVLKSVGRGTYRLKMADEKMQAIMMDRLERAFSRSPQD